MTILNGSEGTTNSPAEASEEQGKEEEQGKDSAETTTSQVASRRGPQEGTAPAHGPTEASLAATRKSSSTAQVESKQNLAKVAETLREDAGQENRNRTSIGRENNWCGAPSTEDTTDSPSSTSADRVDCIARAVAAMEEMRKRAARYRETPKDTTDEDMSAQMEGLQVDDKIAVYEKAFELHPVAIGKAISKMEREETDRNGDSTLVYGEITFKTLALALHKVKTKYGLPGVGSSGEEGVLQGKGGVFYDIGSGTGKPVIAAAIFHPFEKAVGIEILEGLHATSMEVLKQWEGGLRDRVGHQPPTRVEFVHGDAIDLSMRDWSDGDVVFANSTCFDDALMRKLANAATALKKGAIFITLTKRIPAPYFKVLEHEMFPMSWGSATVYISQKTTDPFEEPKEPQDEPRVPVKEAGAGAPGGSYKQDAELDEQTGTE